jgi:hypothetical protein
MTTAAAFLDRSSREEVNFPTRFILFVPLGTIISPFLIDAGRRRGTLYPS